MGSTAANAFAGIAALERTPSFTAQPQLPAKVPAEVELERSLSLPNRGAGQKRPSSPEERTAFTSGEHLPPLPPGFGRSVCV